MASDRLLVEVDSNGVAEYAHFNPDGDLVGWEWEDDCEPVMEANKQRQNDGSRGYSKSREWRHVASIPPGIVRAWEMELGVAAGFLETREGLPILLRKVKDPDFKNFRTT